MNNLSLLALLLILVSNSALAQRGVITQHNDLNRSGWNNHETILHTNNVRPGSFGEIFMRNVDDQIYAQPLVLSNVNIPGVGTKNVVFVATVNNSVYAFDADSANVTQPYWQVNLSPPGTRAVKNTDMTGACGGGYRDFSGNIGIVSTPVIDTITNTIYVVSRNVNPDRTNFQQYFHALDITTGAEKANSPKLISAQVVGNGDGNSGGLVVFDPQKQNQRSGLLLLNGTVYVTWASHCDWAPYHGWIIGYDKTTLAQKTVYCSTPNGYNGGIWMAGAAPSADASGNIYVAVGNGSVGSGNDPTNLTNRSESALKLTPSGSTLAVASYFTPLNYPVLEGSDLDFGVTEILLIPGTNRAMTGCKDGNLYLLNRDNMGGYNASANQMVQNINLGSSAHLRSSLGYYKGQQKEFVYSWSENALLKAFPYDHGTDKFDLANTLSSGVQGPTGNNGALLAVSSNGSLDSTAILWASYAANGDANQSVRPGILHAFSASDITKELWNSGEYPNDNPGNYAKFVCPTIFNGKVYLATFSNKLVVYGLTGQAGGQCNSSNLAAGKNVVASSTSGVSTPANAAVDGNLSTRWSSQYSDPQSIYVDLGQRYDVCKIVLHWETALGQDFHIDVSDDASVWTTMVNITGNASLDNYLPVQGSGRYVRMYGTARATQFGYSLWEFEVYGSPSAYSCAQPNGISVTDIYEGSARLNWNGNGATQFNVQYKTVSAGSWTTASVAADSVTLTGLACATDYLFQVQAICDAADSSKYSATSAFSTLSCNSNCAPLPTRWTTQDIGTVGLAGSACFANGIFELNGSGDDIWNNEDAFRFAYKTLVGDGEIQARILSIDNSDVWNKCGIMIRESLTPGSRNVFIAVTSGNGVALQGRTTTDAGSGSVVVGGITAPAWVKIIKAGSTYTGYRSPDGFVWTQVGNPFDAGFGNGVPVYAGLALTSHNNGVLSTATVDAYQLSGVLDVQIQSFTASLSLSKTVNLQWVTTRENNIQDFVLERSTDNVHYGDIDTVAAASSGTFTHTYHYEDLSPPDQQAFYRLRITDNAGAISYSAPVSVWTIAGVPGALSDEPPRVYANPTQHGVVQVAAGGVPIRSISLYDNTGRLMIVIPNPSADTTTIPVHVYANGIYYVEIRTTKMVYRQKLIIRN